MIRLIASLCLLSLVSCVHTAVSPVGTPGGVPVVIRIPNTHVGQKPRDSQIMAVVENITPWGSNKEREMHRYYPGIADADSAGIAVVVIPGEFLTKKGEKFVGGIPFVAAKSTLPQEMVDRAAARAAADTFRKVSQTSQFVRMSDLAKQPKQTKP